MKKILSNIVFFVIFLVLASCGPALVDDGKKDTSDYKTEFLEAKTKTLALTQYEYDYQLRIDTFFGVVDGPSSISVGNVKFNENSEIELLKVEQNSGSLRDDGTIYTYKDEDFVTTIKTNTDGFVVDVENEAISSSYNYEQSSFAKILFDYDSSKIKSVTKSSNNYEIAYSGGTSNMIGSIISIIGSDIVQGFIDLPSMDSEVNVFTSFDSSGINSFEYKFKLKVSIGILEVNYKMDYKKTSSVSIVVPEFTGLALSEEEINTNLNGIKNILNNYRALENSGYSYKVTTEMDFPGSFAINSTSQGHTLRYFDGTNEYFNNRVEFDSDYKNADLYKKLGIVDYERYYVKYASGDVYRVEDVVGPFNKYELISDSQDDNIESYYMLLDEKFFNFSNFNLIQEKNSGNVKNISLGLNKNAVQELMSFLDVYIKTSMDGSNEIQIFNDVTDIELKSIKAEIVIEDGQLKAITVNVSGTLNATYPNTIFDGYCTFKLQYQIKVNNRADGYRPPKSNSEVILEE